MALVNMQAIYWTIQECTVDVNERRSNADFEWSGRGHDMELSIHWAHLVLRRAIEDGNKVFRK